jgi:hypothetical protein
MPRPVRSRAGASTRSPTSLSVRLLAAAAVCGATVLGAPIREARADNVSSTGKGVTGGALLGAEAVTIVESLAGVRPEWAYVVGALAGAGGGGVGGYFVEKGSSDGKAPMYMLAAGLALVIPAIVLTLDATRYRPEEGATEDRAPTAPAAEPGVPGGSVTGAPADGAPPAPPSSPTGAPPPTTPTSPPHAAPPQSLLDVHQGAFRLGVPVPDVRPVFTMAEQRQYGVHGETELRLPVLHVVF